MIEDSRFAPLFEELPEATRMRAAARMDELARAEAAYCDEDNYIHMCNILAAAALYRTLQDEGKSREDAFGIISTAMWSFLETSKRELQELAERPDSLHTIGAMLAGMFTESGGYGWEYDIGEISDTRVYIECRACIYAQIFAALGMKELGPIFCRSDEIRFGELPGIRFTRRHTLCRDGKTCDFLFERVK